MKKAYLCAVLSGVLAVAPGMAEEFHALSQLLAGLTAMPEAQLASLEGGHIAPECAAKNFNNCDIFITITVNNADVEVRQCHAHLRTMGGTDTGVPGPC
jgi:hypothetical protein